MRDTNPTSYKYIYFTFNVTARVREGEKHLQDWARAFKTFLLRISMLSPSGYFPSENHKIKKVLVWKHKLFPVSQTDVCQEKLLEKTTGVAENFSNQIFAMFYFSMHWETTYY